MRAALAKGVPPRPDEKADAYADAAFEGQHEVLAVLLPLRPPGDDPARLRQALWNAVWNSHPYNEQRTAEHFEQCVRMLLDAGVPANRKDADTLVASAVFTRNPGGNPAVMEMLVRAGADPNPVTGMEGKPGARLLDTVQEACAKGWCSTPVAETLVKLNHLAPRGSEPAPTPAPSPPDRDNH